MRLFEVPPLSWAVAVFQSIADRLVRPWLDPLLQRRVRAIARHEISWLLELRAQVPDTPGSAALFDEAVAGWTRWSLRRTPGRGGREVPLRLLRS
jgi:hypothetical protein